MKRVLFFLYFLSLIACSSSPTLNEAQLFEQSKNQANASSQLNSLAVASFSAVGVLGALGLADRFDLDAALASFSNTKLQGLPKNQGLDINCGTGLEVTLVPSTGGSLTVAGDCALNGVEDCSYDFTGTVTFNPLMLESGLLLSGGLNLSVSLVFPDCFLDLSQVQIMLRGEGMVNEGNLQIQTVEAVLSLLINAGKGTLNPVVQTLMGMGRYLNFTCLPTHLFGNCFLDVDNDGVDDATDNCAPLFNDAQSDTDGDGVGDICDNCPVTPNGDQADGDGDGRGDACVHICAPGIVACETSEDCPIELGCSEVGCCDECEFAFTSLSCRQAEAINEANGLSGACETFNHTCDAGGCCDPLAAPDPLIDFCDDSQDLDGDGFPDVGVCAGGLGFCSDIFYATVCLVFADPGAGCSEAVKDSGIGVACDIDGQLACNVIIASGFSTKEIFCNGICCVEPAP